jgi:RNA polymerase sigma-70 factor (ECF subfamily)
MHDPRLSLLFDRYRREGDLSALAKLFDAISPEMMRVARHVAGRGVDPEDVVQSTFLASIERSESYDADRPLMPWLMGILINQARLMNRRRATRHEESGAEELPADSHEPDDAEALEVQTAVARALADLPPTYREVLVAHLAEGKPPHEIARELGRPQGTVRAQLHRGLRLVRRSLPAGFALGVAAMLDRSALAAVRREVLESAARAHSLPPSAIPAAVSSSKVGVTLAAASILLVAIVVVAWVGGTSARAEPEIALDVPQPLEKRGGALVDARTRRSSASVNVQSAIATQPVADGAAREPSGAVRVTVRNALGDPVAGVHVDLLAWGDPLWHERVRALVTDLDGTVEFERVRAGRVGVHLDGGGKQVRGDVVAGKRCEVTIQLERGLDLAGLVVDARGLPIEGAVVELGADPSVEPRRVSRPTGPDGRFEMPDVERNLAVWARSESRPASEAVWFGTPTWSVRESGEVRFVLADPIAPLAFSVVDARGEPIAGALAVGLEGSVDGDSTAAIRADGALVLGSHAACARSSSTGVVRLSVDRAHIDRIAVSAAGYAPRELAIADVGTLVALEQGVRLGGVARFQDGVAADAALVEVRSDGLNEPLRTNADVDGSWAIADVPAGPFTVACRASREAAPSEMRGIAAAGGSVIWNPILAHADSIRGVARSAHGGPAKTWLVKAVREGGPQQPLLSTWTSSRASAERGQDLRQAWTDSAQGTFVVPCEPGATYRLELRPRAMWDGQVWGVLEGVAAGARDVDLRAHEERGFVRARFLDEDGLPAAGVLSAVQRGSGAEHHNSAQADGRVERDLFPGTYTVVAWPVGSAPFSLGVHVVGGDQVVDLGDVRVQSKGALTIRGASSGRVVVLGRDGLVYSTVRDGERRVAAGLPVGDYVVKLTRADGAATLHPVRVEAGTESALELP